MGPRCLKLWHSPASSITHRIRTRSPTDQKVGGSIPSERTQEIPATAGISPFWGAVAGTTGRPRAHQGRQQVDAFPVCQGEVRHRVISETAARAADVAERAA